MSSDQELLVRQGYEAWNREDLNWFLAHLTEDAEVQPVRGLEGFEPVYRGHDGWRRFWEQWRSSWKRFEIRVQRVEDMEERGVLVLLAVDAESGNGREALSTSVSHWLTFREGLVSGITAMPPETAERRREARA